MDLIIESVQSIQPVNRETSGAMAMIMMLGNKESQQESDGRATTERQQGYDDQSDRTELRLAQRVVFSFARYKLRLFVR